MAFDWTMNGDFTLGNEIQPIIALGTEGAIKNWKIIASYR